MGLPGTQLLFPFAVEKITEADIAAIVAKLPKNRDLLTAGDIAMAMEVTLWSVYAWIESGDLQAINCGAGKIKHFYKVYRGFFIDFLRKRIAGATYEEK